MAASLKGAPELRRRLKAIKTVFKPAGREWADTTTQIAKNMVPVKTGRLRGSIRRRNASMKRATVVGHYSANFVDAGVKAHDITAKKMHALKFSTGGPQPVFRRKVHKQRIAARPFKRRAAEEGLRQVDILGDLIELWNRAA
jgi:hypothetical protein